MYYIAIYMLGFGFSLGLQVVVARRNGEGNLAQTGEIFWQGLLFLVSLSILTFTLSKVASPLILRKVISSGEIYQAVMKYIDWRDYSFLFVFPILAYRAFFVGITQTKVLTANSILLVTTNAALNYLLIFGACGFPRLGIAGAAIASSLAEIAALIHIVIYTHLKIDKKKYGWRPTVNLPLLGQLFRISSWTMIRSFFCIAPWFLFFIAIEHLGERQLAAGNVVRSVSVMLFVIVNSFATTGISLVSNLIGAQQVNNVLPICWKTVKLSYAVGTPFVLTAALLSKPILGIYTNSSEVIETAYAPFLLMLSTFFWLLLPIPIAMQLSGQENQNGIRISNNHNHRLSGVFVRAIHPRTVTINHVLDGRAALCFIASGFISLLSEKRELETVKRKVHGDLS